MNEAGNLYYHESVIRQTSLNVIDAKSHYSQADDHLAAVIADLVRCICDQDKSTVLDNVHLTGRGKPNLVRVRGWEVHRARKQQRSSNLRIWGARWSKTAHSLRQIPNDSRSRGSGSAIPDAYNGIGASFSSGTWRYLESWTPRSAPSWCNNSLPANTSHL